MTRLKRRFAVAFAAMAIAAVAGLSTDARAMTEEKYRSTSERDPCGPRCAVFENDTCNCIELPEIIVKPKP